MSKKHTRKPAPAYPPSWFDASPFVDRIHPLAHAVARTMRSRMQGGRL